MGFWKKTTMVLLTGMIAFPVMGMQDLITAKKSQKEGREQFLPSENRKEVQYMLDWVKHECVPTLERQEELIQAYLNYSREKENENDIKIFEGLSREVHSLMSLLEQFQQTASAYLADDMNQSKYAIYQELGKKIHQNYQALITNKDLHKATMDAPVDFHLEKYIGSDIFNPEALCPDRFIIGKQVTALFPHFSKEGWQRSYQSRDMRTARPKEPMTQIRLQNKLWDVFANTKENQPNQLQNNEAMVFLDEKNTSKRCVYKFDISEGMGHLAGPPWWGAQITTYSILLIPAKDQNPEPRDRNYDEVPERLEEEIKGERLKTGDTTNPEESRAAVNEEMRQRLARRDFEENRTRRLHRRGIPMDQENEGYLMPSDIKDQTYMRVHVPDYRYGRAYERAHNFVPSTAASRDEMMAAQTQREDWEVTEGHVSEGKDY